MPLVIRTKAPAYNNDLKKICDFCDEIEKYIKQFAWPAYDCYVCYSDEPIFFNKGFTIVGYGPIKAYFHFRLGDQTDLIRLTFPCSDKVDECLNDKAKFDAFVKDKKIWEQSMDIMKKWKFSGCPLDHLKPYSKEDEEEAVDNWSRGLNLA